MAPYAVCVTYACRIRLHTYVAYGLMRDIRMRDIRMRDIRMSQAHALRVWCVPCRVYSVRSCVCVCVCVCVCMCACVHVRMCACMRVWLVFIGRTRFIGRVRQRRRKAKGDWFKMRRETGQATGYARAYRDADIEILRSRYEY